MAKKEKGINRQTFELGFFLNLGIVGATIVVAIIGVLFMFGGMATVRDGKEHSRNAEIFGGYGLLIVGLICAIVVLGASGVLTLDSLI